MADYRPRFDLGRPGDVSTDLMPAWLPNISKPSMVKLPATRRDGAAAVYFSACVNRIVGDSKGSVRLPSLTETLVTVRRGLGTFATFPSEVGR